MKYIVDIIEKDFIISDAGNDVAIGNKTAVVTFYDLNTAKSVSREYCYRDIEEIFGLIDKGMEINLSNCYLKSFSIDDYKKKKAPEDGEKIVVRLGPAVNSFFDGRDSDGADGHGTNACLDLSGAAIKSDGLDFSGAIFAGGDLLLNNTEFTDCEKVFKDCDFGACNIDFSSCNFGSGNIDFSGSKCTRGNKIFSGIKINKGKLKFINTRFGNGDLDFSFAKIMEGNLEFSKSVFGSGTKNFSKASFGKGNVDFSSTEFGKGDLFFISTKFNEGNVYFLGSRLDEGNVDFFRSRFGDGNKDFSFIKFGKGVVNFNHSKFGDGDVNFYSTDFGTGDVIFSKSEFGNGEINFSNAIMTEGKAEFNDVMFGSGRVDFSGVSFGDGKIDFSGSAFVNGRIDFSKSNYGKGEIDFSNVDFGKGYVSFRESHFEFNKVTFFNSSIPTITFQQCQFNQYTDLRVKSCDHMDLRNTIFRDIIDLKPYDETLVKIKHLNFAEAKNSGLIFNDWKANDIKNAITVQENTTFRQKAEQFRMMKENYHNIGQYDDEDFSYVEFKRFENKADLYEVMRSSRRNIFMKAYAAVRFFFKWLVFDQIGRFGTNPLRVLSSMVFAFILFTFIYLPLQQVPNFSDPANPVNTGATTIMDAAYFSAYNILLIGYDAYHPAGITGSLSVIESFLGAFLMSYFTIAFVRKVLR